MANLGISDTSTLKRSSFIAAIAKRRKLETAFHIVLLSAAFVFVAAIVCGVLV